MRQQALGVHMQIMVRRESEGASALMLFRKKADVAPVDPLFFPAPPAHTSNEVRSALTTLLQHKQALPFMICAK